MEKVTLPLNFLKQNDAQEIGRDYLRHLILASIEALNIKNKMVDNYKAQNINLAKRISDLTAGQNPPEYFYDPDTKYNQNTCLNENHPVV